VAYCTGSTSVRAASRLNQIGYRAKLFSDKMSIIVLLETNIRFDTVVFTQCFVCDPPFRHLRPFCGQNLGKNGSFPPQNTDIRVLL